MEGVGTENNLVLRSIDLMTAAQTEDSLRVLMVGQ